MVVDKLQALVYDILLGGSCRKAMLGVWVVDTPHSVQHVTWCDGDKTVRWCDGDQTMSRGVMVIKLCHVVRWLLNYVTQCDGGQNMLHSNTVVRTCHTVRWWSER